MREGPAGKKLRVLLVEDNRADAWLVRSALASARESQFELTEVALLSEAFEVLRGQPQDAVLLDLALPDSQGLVSFTSMHARFRLVPVIVLSGLDDESSALYAVRLGAQDYLVKGKYESELLVRAIQYAIERQRLLGQVERALSYVRRLLLETREKPGRLAARSDELAMCSWCKRVRDDSGAWRTIDEYLASPTQTSLTLLTCPGCGNELREERSGT